MSRVKDTNWDEETINNYRLLIKNAHGWVISNMRKYGNSLVPTKAIKTMQGTKNVSRLLTMIMEEPVRVRYVSIKDQTARHSKKVTDEYYIAEIERLYPNK